MAEVNSTPTAEPRRSRHQAAVYVYHGSVKYPTPRRAQMLQLSENAEMAQLLAKGIHDTFGCPAWVADYFQPADVMNIRYRAEFEAFKASQRAQS